MEELKGWIFAFAVVGMTSAVWYKRGKVSGAREGFREGSRLGRKLALIEISMHAEELAGI